MHSASRTRSICIIAELIFLSANVEAEDLRTLLKQGNWLLGMIGRRSIVTAWSRTAL